MYTYKDGAIIKSDIQHTRNTKIERVLNYATDGIAKFALDDYYTPLYLNENIAKLIGVDQETLSKRDFESRNYIHPDDIAEVRALTEKGIAAGHPFSLHFRLKHADGHSIWVKANVVSANELYKDKYPVFYCIYTDITNMILKQKQFQSEIEYQNSADNDNLLSKQRANITQNKIEVYYSKPYLHIDISSLSYEDGAETLASTALTESERLQLAEMLSIDHIRTMSASGEKTASLQYKRKTPDGVIWAETSIKIFTNPDNEDLMCFLYSYDISKEKDMHELLSTVINLDYDYLAVLDITTGRYKIHTKKMLCDSPIPAEHSDNYEDVVREYANANIVPEEIETSIKDMSIENIKNKLEKNDRYVSFSSIRGHSGKVQRKRLQFSYLGSDRTQVLVTRMDITDIYKKELERQEELKNALLAAQQGSKAKSEFLSRMSHEIRTPMNAVIGMAALAEECIDDPAQALDYLAKVRASARFLLSLINDILDMSRIESGSVLLKQEEISFQNFVDGINAICYEQANARGVDYETVITTRIDDYYVGDMTKIQQVLLNLLTNAIKFTDRDGKVRMTISRERKSKDYALLKFTVKDSGIGISKEFLPNIFEPFSQQNSSFTSVYGGCGLGLAISKNLVTLMGGEIRANSIEGVGSEFTVELKLGLSEHKQNANDETPDSFPIGLKVLVIDDDIVICRHIKELFEDLGLEADCSASGENGTELVRMQRELGHEYDIIIIDWKMPHRDGIETTRIMRHELGVRSPIVVMTAYDRQSIETEAKDAGAAMVTSKPLFKNAALSIIKEIYSRKKAVRKKLQCSEYDFSGKRILVAEDHKLNIEVAKKLLESKKATVETAENGLIAIELFAAAPSGYYDAILMDIRMPVMDGILAAKAIRHMDQNTSVHIPIIAMTANAFDEDVQHSLDAGMDAHIAKPIEPSVLFDTLMDAFDKNKKAIS